jgi:hypothetical protein
MLHPLASLWRHNCRVTFYESGGQPAHALSGAQRPHQHPVAGSPRTFLCNEDASQYLRYWMGEPAARAELKWVLQRSGPALAATRAGDDGWLQALAGRIATGAIAVMEELGRQAMPGRLVASAGAADAATEVAVAALAALPPLVSVPKAPALAPPLLPVLEELRVEGAEVLPELEQSLEQVELSIASFAGASLSLDPAPDKVAQITDAMKAAASRADATLSAL